MEPGALGARRHRQAGVRRHRARSSAPEAPGRERDAGHQGDPPGPRSPRERGEHREAHGRGRRPRGTPVAPLQRRGGSREAAVPGGVLDAGALRGSLRRSAGDPRPHRQVRRRGARAGPTSSQVHRPPRHRQLHAPAERRGDQRGHDVARDARPRRPARDRERHPLREPSPRLRPAGIRIGSTPARGAASERRSP